MITEVEKSIENVILEDLRKKTTEIAKEEIEKAKRKIEEEISKYIDNIVVSIFNYFDIESFGHRIIITVDKRKLLKEKSEKWKEKDNKVIFLLKLCMEVGKTPIILSG